MTKDFVPESFFLIKFYTKNYDLANKLSACKQFNINRVKTYSQNIEFAKSCKVLDLTVKGLDIRQTPSGKATTI